MQRWLTHPRLLDSDNIVILIAESLSDIHPRVRENARLAGIRIPYPDEAERYEYLSEFIKAAPFRIEMSVSQLAAMTSGLNFVHLRSLLRGAQFSDNGLTFDDLRAKKKEIIEAESARAASRDRPDVPQPRMKTLRPSPLSSHRRATR